MKHALLVLAPVLALAGCSANTPPLEDLPTSADVAVRVAVDQPDMEEFLRGFQDRAARGLVRVHGRAAATDSLIFWVGDVVECSWDVGMATEFLYLWDHPDVPSSPEATALLGSSCFSGTLQSSKMLAELNAVLQGLRGWTVDLVVASNEDEFSFVKLVHLYDYRMPPGAIWGPGSRGLDHAAMTCDPATGQLWMRVKGNLAPLTPPGDPGLDPATYRGNPGACPVATEPGIPRVNEGLFAGVCDPARVTGGMAIVGSRFWIGLYEFYNVAGRDNFGVASIEVDGTPPAIGPWRVGPVNVHDPYPDVYHANKAHQWVVVIPPHARAAFGGREVAAGRSRGAGAFGGANGPALFAFFADPTAPVSSHLGGIPLIVYPGGQWSPGAKNVENDYVVSATSVYSGSSWSVVFSRTKGDGKNYYGPGICNPNKGWHANPYRWILYRYAGEDLAAVAAGQMSEWEIQAVEEYDMTGVAWRSVDPTCEFPNATAWQHTTGELHVAELQAYRPAGSSVAVPIVHVFGFRDAS